MALTYISKIDGYYCQLIKLWLVFELELKIKFGS